MERIEQDTKLRRLKKEGQIATLEALKLRAEKSDKFWNPLGWLHRSNYNLARWMVIEDHNQAIDKRELSESLPTSDPNYVDPETGLTIDQQLAKNKAIVEEADKNKILWDIDDLNELPGYKDVRHTTLHDPTNPEHVLLVGVFG